MLNYALKLKDIRFKAIDNLTAQSKITNYETEDLYFITVYFPIPNSNTSRYKPNGLEKSELIKYDSTVRKMFFKVQATPKNILNIGEEYFSHQWFIKEDIDE